MYLGTDQVEQETAWAADFSAMAIVEEEEELLPSKASELSYVKVCTHRQPLAIGKDHPAFLYAERPYYKPTPLGLFHFPHGIAT